MGRYSRIERKRFLWAYVLIAPTILGLFVLNLWPILRTFRLGFFRSSGIGRMRYVGLENYAALVRDPEVWQALCNTLVFALYSVVLTLAFSLLFASLIHNGVKRKGPYMTVYFLPNLVAPAALAMVWRWILNSDYGILNQFLGLFHVPVVRWVTGPATVIPAIAMVDAWSQLGYRMIIILAGMASIPQSVVEAAQIDGTNQVQRFFHVTLPLLSPTVFFVAVTLTIDSLKEFSNVFMMVSLESPVLSDAQTILYLFYRQAFVAGNKGYASAIAVLALFLILAVTMVQFGMQGKWVHYD